MKEEIADFIVAKYLGKRISGWHTKMGAAVTTLLALIGVLSVLVQALELATDGHYYGAFWMLQSPEMIAALAALGLTKQFLGVKSALDKQGDATVAAVAEAAALSPPIATP